MKQAIECRLKDHGLKELGAAIKPKLYQTFIDFAFKIKRKLHVNIYPSSQN